MVNVFLNESLKVKGFAPQTPLLMKNMHIRKNLEEKEIKYHIPVMKFDVENVECVD